MLMILSSSYYNKEIIANKKQNQNKKYKCDSKRMEQLQGKKIKTYPLLPIFW